MPSLVDYYATSNTYPTHALKNAASHPVSRNGHASSSTERKHELLDKFVEAYEELEAYKWVCSPSPSLLMLNESIIRDGKPVVVDGQNLSIPAVAAAARYGASVALDESSEVRDRVLSSRRVIVDKVSNERSVYGVSTGFGGSGTYAVRC
jgi:phenylalanine ammonia-lyase